MGMSVNIISDGLVEKVNLGQSPPPADWVSRRLFTGREGARNWLAVVGEPSYAEHAHAPFGLQSLCREAVARVRAGTMVPLGPGDGNFDAELVRVLKGNDPALAYIPVDISRDLLEAAICRIGRVASVPVGVLADMEGGGSLLREALDRFARRPILFSLLGCTVCNLDLGEHHFFGAMRELMRSDDFFLLDIPLAGQAWTVDDDPRLDKSQYTDHLKRFLVGGLTHWDPDFRADAGPDWFDEQIERAVSTGGAVEGTKVFTIRDRRTGQTLLSIRLYEWHAIREWFRSVGFEIAYDDCSLSSPADKLGMGVVLLSRRGGAE